MGFESADRFEEAVLYVQVKGHVRVKQKYGITFTVSTNSTYFPTLPFTIPVDTHSFKLEEGEHVQEVVTVMPVGGMGARVGWEQSSDQSLEEEGGVMVVVNKKGQVGVVPKEVMDREEG